MKIIFSIILMLLGFCVYLFWLSGSHGHIRLRPNMKQDWVMAGILLTCFITSIFLFISWFNQRKRGFK